jgi:hypothetical protein
MKLVIDMAGLCAFVRRRATEGGRKVDRELRVLMLDPSLHAGRGHDQALPKHHPILAVPVEYTEDEPDEIIHAPDGMPLCLWHLDGHELQFEKLGPAGLQVEEDARHADAGDDPETQKPADDDECRDFSWIPDLERVCHVGKADRRYVVGPPPTGSILAARVVALQGRLEAVLEEYARNRVFRFEPPRSPAPFCQALAERARLTITVPYKTHNLAISFHNLASTKPVRKIILNLKGSKNVGLALGCFPSERGMAMKSTGMSHFKAFYDLSEKGHDLPPKKRPVPVPMNSTTSVAARTPHVTWCIPTSLTDPLP